MGGWKSLTMKRFPEGCVQLVQFILICSALAYSMPHVFRGVYAALAMALTPRYFIYILTSRFLLCCSAEIPTGERSKVMK